MIPMRRIAVLISGRGSNLAALLQAEAAGALGGSIVLVISNRADAAGLAVARAHGCATAVIEHAGRDRPAFEAEISSALERNGCDLTVLAGFMRIFTAAFVARHAGRLINIHPSLLPSFPGLETHRRALEDGVRIHGCTVHFVTAALDHGPIIAQAALAVQAEDDASTLAKRVLTLEHQLLPRAVRAWCEDRLVIAGASVRVKGESASASVLQVPRLYA
ncbi:MAG: phosphoribosylglycinamide formyltransferase [Pseudomonadota bacterium]|nr:phosphoribosylglycinamide formyltransferase [Pseudomonadota bacterium]